MADVPRPAATARAALAEATWAELFEPAWRERLAQAQDVPRNRILRDEVIPLYYQRDRDGLPRGWIKRMKRTIRTLGWRFNADRMVMDYAMKCYVPAAGGQSSDMRSGL